MYQVTPLDTQTSYLKDFFDFWIKKSPEKTSGLTYIGTHYKTHTL